MITMSLPWSTEKTNDGALGVPMGVAPETMSGTARSSSRWLTISTGIFSRSKSPAAWATSGRKRPILDTPIPIFIVFIVLHDHGFLNWRTACLIRHRGRSPFTPALPAPSNNTCRCQCYTVNKIVSKRFFITILANSISSKSGSLSRRQRIRFRELFVERDDLGVARQIADRLLDLFTSERRRLAPHELFEVLLKTGIFESPRHGFAQNLHQLRRCARRKMMRPARH